MNMQRLEGTCEATTQTFLTPILFRQRPGLAYTANVYMCVWGGGGHIQLCACLDPRMSWFAVLFECLPRVVNHTCQALAVKACVMHPLHHAMDDVQLIGIPPNCRTVGNMLVVLEECVLQDRTSL